MPRKQPIYSCNLPESSSEESLSEACFMACCCRNGSANPNTCLDCMINDRTYSALRRICAKIIKAHERGQCKEKFTLFDGGNSLKLQSPGSSDSCSSNGSLKSVSTHSRLSAGGTLKPISQKRKRSTGSVQKGNILAKKAEKTDVVAKVNKQAKEKIKEIMTLGSEKRKRPIQRKKRKDTT